MARWVVDLLATALRAFIERTQPGLVVCGHIHEARGIERIGRTTIVNCGSAHAGRYALAEVGDALKMSLRDGSRR